ncbi:hypothetical protein Q428_07465 [Fervidicella metallireducens AeB]|uniref:GGDEF domain-containing protein n=1 Tax=Fervidicella metallireducens AeB TaxID=1403537 RepID=A0A017RV16_9CLOT|nr:sensor domain-containing diguanylate cyclase [Fervidicella metallireducens]EYE88507.1 hypothetical protein Q428_07465 [Fervidicella metallireducens AeB]
MKKNKIPHSIFRLFLYIFTGYILFHCISDANFKDIDLQGFVLLIISLTACIAMRTMVIDVGKMSLDFTDTLTVFLIIVFGVEISVIFELISLVISFIFIDIHIKKRLNLSRHLFNIPMFIINIYLSAKIAEDILRHINLSGFAGKIVAFLLIMLLYILVNITFIQIESTLKSGKYNRMSHEARGMIITNYIVSTMVSITLYIAYQYSEYACVLVIGNLIIIQYSIYLFKKLQAKNEAIKTLLKITEDIVKYGDFRDKCKHLIISLKELIPYTVCAVYTFDIENDAVVYPVAYNGNEDIDIGEMMFNISETGKTIRTLMEGKVYISKNVDKDQKIRITGKLLQVSEVMIFAPIIIKGKISGVIMISGGRELSEFVDNGIQEIISILSNQMALAIENDTFYRSMQMQANRDTLTRLYNRRVFDREIENLIESETPFSLVMYDVDNFKTVNDNYGHLIGDEVLKSISDIIMKSIRKTDIPCRFGGEEIAIIFKDLSKEDALIISERIRERVEEMNIKVGEENLKITISGGIASYPEDGNEKNSVIDNADTVLYKECKERGRNRVCVFNRGINKEAGADCRDKQSCSQ